MNTTHYALFCKFGMLAHGPKEWIEKERQCFTNHSDDEFRVEEYDFQTHTVTNEGIVPRDVPLTFYSANDLYRIDPIRAENSLWRSMDEMFPELRGYYCDPSRHMKDIEVRIIHQNEGSTIATIWFKNQPFMICQYFGHEGYGFNRFITNRGTYDQVVDYLRELNRIDVTDIIDPDEVRIDLTCFDYNIIPNFDRK